MATNPTPAANIGKTIVTTAEGDVVAFGGFVAKITVAHPRWMLAIFSFASFAIGFLVR